MENFKFREAVKWGLKIFAPNQQKAHPYAKYGRTNCLAYVPVTLFWHYTATRKKYARTPIGNSMSSITLQPLPRRRDQSLDHPEYIRCNFHVARIRRISRSLSGARCCLKFCNKYRKRPCFGTFITENAAKILISVAQYDIVLAFAVPHVIGND